MDPPSLSHLSPPHRAEGEERYPMSLKDFAGTLPDFAKDIRLNVGSLLNESHLPDQQKYGLLLTCAPASSLPMTHRYFLF